MKLRSGFVSNSSSSSFLVVGTPEYMPDDYWEPIRQPVPVDNYVELTTEQKQLVRSQGFDIPLDKQVFLTRYYSDGSEGILFNSIPYKDGGHGGPYSRANYTEIADNIWLWEGADED